MAWLLLCAAFALHVLDEAANGFLLLYNPIVLSLRERLPLLPPPTFRFGAWLALLITAIIVLALLAPLARAKSGWIIMLGTGFALIMFANGATHLCISVLRGEMIPGTWSSPILLAAALNLLGVFYHAGADSQPR
ncbi:MAG: HXXEE domain-containing protein [Candidatus Hydrogenedentes bacterium]|nr:HXXEE domain-containing protein [Candidatus Hydrogenedentota bacterium]